MKDFIKSCEKLPTIVKFILVLIGDICANIYRLCRSIAAKSVLGIILSIVLLCTGGFAILWIVDLVMIVLGKNVWWFC